MMKPKYQAMKKIVAGSTQLRRFLTSSWNSGEFSAASQSISGWWVAPPARGPSSGLCHEALSLLS